MRSKVISAAVFGAILCAAAPALAWSERPYTQPASSEIAVWAYPSKTNYCPAGLQPVVVGGVVCCGQPTHVGYKPHQKAKRYKQKAKPYVAYSKGYVASGKGYGEGYSE